MDFSKCDKLGVDFNFDGCLVSLCNFSTLTLNSVKFCDCQIFNCDFLDVDLTKSTFENSYFKNTRFIDCNLSFVSFKHSVNYNIDPNRNVFKKTKFSMPEAINLLNYFDIEID